MSFNQPRHQKSEAPQDRRAGRSASFNQQRTSSGGYSEGGGAPAPAAAPSISSKRSLKKSNNVQGGQSGVNVRPSNISSEPAGATPTQHNLQNGANVQPQPQSQGQSDAGHAGATSKSAETPPAANRSTRAVPNAPTSQPPTMSSETPPPSTPQKVPVDASKAFSFQFGSLSPDLIDGIQIAARTSSAPPNLDEQKRDQAGHDAFKAGPQAPVPATPKHPLPKRDLGATDQSNAGDSHTVSKGKKDQVPPIPPSVQSQKPPAHAAPGMSMKMPFNQPQVPIQFRGRNTSIQSQGMASTSLQLPIPMPMLPVGNAPPSMQQQTFVTGLQAHMIQPQGNMHQGQGLRFGAQINPQFPSQLGTLGMGISPYSQQGAKFGGPCETPVKITHPETHQEVRLDKRSQGFSYGGPSSWSPSNVPPQAQHISSYPSNHPVNYFTNSYSPGGPSSWSRSNVPPQAQHISSYPSNHPVNYFTNSYSPRGPLSKEPGSDVGTLPGRNKQYAGSTGAEIISSSSNIARGKKKGKKLLQKADAAGATLDLNMAYKGSEEKKEAVKSSRGAEIASEDIHANQAAAETSPKETVVSDDVEQTKAEIDDWEDAADVCSPALEPSTSRQQVDVFAPSSENRNGFFARKHSTDFLLKFAKRCTNLPENFEVTHAIAEAFNAGSTGAEINRSSCNIARGKKKRKEFLQKANAAGATLDLYITYKGPEEKKEAVKSSRGADIASEDIHANQAAAETSPKEAVVSDDVEQTKAEIDDWEDAADVSSPALEPSTSGQQVDVFVPSSENRSGFFARKYSRDFLLKFAKRCTDLPENFEVTHAIAEAFNAGSTGAEISRSSSNLARGKKKRKEFLQKADAAGATRDLYMAYKGPEEKKEAVKSSRGAEIASEGIHADQAAAEAFNL